MIICKECGSLINENLQSDEINCNVEILTPEECGILYRNLKSHWLDRSDNYVQANAVVTRLYRRWMGMDL